MQQHNLEQIAFLEWIVLVAPLAFIMLMIIPYLLSIGLGDIKLDNEVKMKKKDGNITAW